jgi:hypothetical protein
MRSNPGADAILFKNSRRPGGSWPSKSSARLIASHSARVRPRRASICRLPSANIIFRMPSESFATLTFSPSAMHGLGASGKQHGENNPTPLHVVDHISFVLGQIRERHPCTSPCRAGADEIFHHGLAQHVRRQQALRQDEVVEALDVELWPESLLSRFPNFE